MVLIIIIAVVVVVIALFAKNDDTSSNSTQTYYAPRPLDVEEVKPKTSSEDYKEKRNREIEEAREAVHEEYKDLQSLEVKIVGVFYRSAAVKDLVPYLDVRDEIKLAKEPKNPYDEFAVKVIYDRKNLGYIPREYSEMATGLINTKRVRKVIIERAGDAKISPWDNPDPYAFIRIFYV